MKTEKEKRGELGVCFDAYFFRSIKNAAIPIAAIIAIVDPKIYMLVLSDGVVLGPFPSVPESDSTTPTYVDVCEPQ